MTENTEMIITFPYISFSCPNGIYTAQSFLIGISNFRVGVAVSDLLCQTVKLKCACFRQLRRYPKLSRHVNGNLLLVPQTTLKMSQTGVSI